MSSNKTVHFSIICSSRIEFHFRLILSRVVDIDVLLYFQLSRLSDYFLPLTLVLQPDELSDPNLTPLPMHPEMKYVAALAAT